MQDSTATIEHKEPAIHPQSGCNLFVDTLSQATTGFPAVCSGVNLRTNVHI